MGGVGFPVGIEAERAVLMGQPREVFISDQVQIGGILFCLDQIGPARIGNGQIDSRKSEAEGHQFEMFDIRRLFIGLKKEVLVAAAFLKGKPGFGQGRKGLRREFYGMAPVFESVAAQLIPVGLSVEAVLYQLVILLQLNEHRGAEGDHRGVAMRIERIDIPAVVGIVGFADHALILTAMDGAFPFIGLEKTAGPFQINRPLSRRFQSGKNIAVGREQQEIDEILPAAESQGRQRQIAAAGTPRAAGAGGIAPCLLSDNQIAWQGNLFFQFLSLSDKG